MRKLSFSSGKPSLAGEIQYLCPARPEVGKDWQLICCWDESWRQPPHPELFNPVTLIEESLKLVLKSGLWSWPDSCRPNFDRLERMFSICEEEAKYGLRKEDTGNSILRVRRGECYTCRSGGRKRDWSSVGPSSALAGWRLSPILPSAVWLISTSSLAREITPYSG